MTSTEKDATRNFILSQTMLRIKEPAISLAFYEDVLGMTLLDRFDFPELKFSLYFVAYLAAEQEVPSDPAERANFVFNQRGAIELTHNWGSEDDPDFKGYHNGNTDPRGFGHIGITVPDVYAACERFDRLGVNFVKRPDDGAMKGLAFITDPDGYWIEVLSAKGLAKIVLPDGPTTGDA